MIRVTPEGQEGFWLVDDRASLKEWITAQAAAADGPDEYVIHNFLVGNLMLGADHGLAGATGVVFADAGQADAEATWAEEEFGLTGGHVGMVLAVLGGPDDQMPAVSEPESAR